jgi:glutamyl-tRNA synthetase
VSNAGVVGRYAPSPSGGLHLGNARTALLAWLHVRSQGGRFLMRIEDLDRARSAPGAAQGMLADLRWLGLDWDEGPDVGGPHGAYVQSERSPLYEAAIERLTTKGLLFECFCSRTEVAASAPHGPGDDGPRYPGTCRELAASVAAAKRKEGRAGALRFKVPPGVVVFADGLRGEVRLDISTAVGDFVVRRADGVFAYQLAVAVDDALMGVTDVLRGEDLLTSTPRQIQLLRALELQVPHYTHVPLVLGTDGKRLCKRGGDLTLGALRAKGVAPERIVAALARSSGLTERKECSAWELVAGFDVERISREPAVLDAAELYT